ncbi:MAG: hypothetical protein ABSF84_14095 [Acidimicrobiales bacterium]|jgi:hypothetical protein
MADETDEQVDSNAPRGARVEFCGEVYRLDPTTVFTIGREGDLVIDSNPFLHRRFLQLRMGDGLWWVANVGSQVAATVASTGSSFHAWLAPGSRIPLVFNATTLRFTAGATTYEIDLILDEAPYETVDWNSDHGMGGTTTMNLVDLTPEQVRLVLALCEPILRAGGAGVTQIPTSAQAAERLGWTLTKFNRKLDVICEKLDQRGLRGLRGDSERLAVNRRAGLVELAVSTRMVQIEDLALLDGDPAPGSSPH